MRWSWTVILLVSTACGAVGKTAPVAPSGLIAACSAGELAIALKLDRSKHKIKHGITIGSEREVSATVGAEAGPAKMEVGAKTGTSQEKSSEIELELPSPMLCAAHGYVPQLGVWRWSEVRSAEILEIAGADGTAVLAEASLMADGRCVRSDTNNCFCRGLGQTSDRPCSQAKISRQIATIKDATALARREQEKIDKEKELARQE